MLYEFVQELKGRVDMLKRSAKEKAEYMTFEMKINEERYKAKQEGFEKGHEEGHKSGLREGEQKAIFKLVQGHLLEPSVAARQLSLTIDEFIEKMVAAGYENPMEIKA